MSNIIVELSNNTASTQVTNGDFETIFPIPIIINQGDVIQIKNAFIDTIQQTYDQIYIPNDINISLTVCYYEIDVTMHNPVSGTETTKIYSPLHTRGSGQTLSNWEFYLAFTGTVGHRRLLRNIIYGVIASGLYTPTSLAIEITKQLTMANSPQSGGGTLPDQDFSIQISTYPQAFDFMTFVKMVPDNDPTLCQMAYGDYYSYVEPDGVNLEYSYFTGAKLVEVTYNNQGNNKFEFTYLHTPSYDDNGNMQISFAGGNFNQGITRESGCMFLDMQPREFWTSLGFNIPAMIPTFDDYTNENPQILYFDNNKMTTEALFTLDDLYGAKFGGVANAGMYARHIVAAAKISNYTRGMSADQFYSFKRLSPFVLIEFITNYNGMYLTGSDKSRFISAVVSRNYTQNNYITGYSDSSIVYEHKGESFALSNIRTRILNPDTKDVEFDIGGNNYIILNIIKNT